MSAADLIRRLNTALEGRYRIERELGEGGMARVYLAEDLRHGRKVALKVLKPELAASLGVERFLVEIRTTANLQHPNILPLFDSGDAGGLPFYATPYIRGETLRKKLDRDARMPVDTAVRIAKEIAEALRVAHAQGIVHRDIKPANILLSNERALVADFGVSLALSAAGTGLKTGPGVTIGTPKYMSPEQASGEHDVDERSDVYSVAAVLYEMLAGEPPYTGSTAQVVLAKRMTQPVPSVRRLRAGVPDSVDKAIQRALQMNPSDRTPSTTDLIKALSGEEAERRSSRAPLVAAIAGAVAVMLGGALVAASSDSTGAVAAHQEHRIAVMPMETVSDDEDTAYLAEGMTDEIRHQLGKVASLRVSSRRAVEGSMARSSSLEAIGRSLGVEALLQGSIRQAGARIRVTAQLVDIASGRVVWSDEYEDALENVFEVQRAIAVDIAGTLDGALTADEARRLGRPPTQSLAAYAVYDRGRRASAANPERVRVRIQLFEAAVAMDSTFAEAWAWLSEGHFRLGVYTQDRAILDQGEALARHAIKLDPESEMAYLALAQNLWFSGRLRESGDAFLRSLDLNPSFFDASDIGLLMELMGRHDEALHWVRRFHELEPNSAFTTWRLVRPLIALGAVPEAQEVLSGALAEYPRSSRLRGAQTLLDALQGKSGAVLEQSRAQLADYPNSQEVALRALDFLQIFDGDMAEAGLERLASSSPEARMFLTGRTVRTARAFDLWRSGDSGRADTAFDESRASALDALALGDERWYIPYELASIAAIRGQNELALDRLEQAYETGFTRGWLLLRDPMLSTLVHEQRFLDLVARIEGDVAAMRTDALRRAQGGTTDNR